MVHIRHTDDAQECAGLTTDAVVQQEKLSVGDSALGATMKSFARSNLWIFLCLAVATPAKGFVGPVSSHSPALSSSSALSAQFKPSSRAQGKVMIDPKTGLYRPVKKVQGRNADSSDAGNSWDGIKEVVYKGVDSLSSLPGALERIGQNPEEDVSLASVVGGYADIERELGATAEQPLQKRIATPVDKILKRSSSLSAGTNMSYSSSPPLIPPTRLEKAKAFFWKSIDSARQAQASTTTMSSTLESFQPAVRARLIASDEFLQALEELDSSNPVVRLTAGRRIRKLAQQQQKQMQEGSNPLNKLKSKFYQAVDRVQATGRQIAALPSKAAVTYQATVETSQKAVEAAQQVPSKVQSQAKAVQQSIQDTVEATQQTFETVQNLPSEIQNSIETTKQDVQAKVKATVDTAQSVKSTVQSITTQSKVLLGLEKPQPKPPSTPPPEPWTARKAAWKVFSISTSLAAQTAWFVGKNGAKLAWKVGSVAAEKGGEVVEAQMKEYKAQQTKKVAQTASGTKPAKKPSVRSKAASAAVTATPKPSSRPSDSIAPTVDFQAKAEQQAQEMDALEIEIEEALRLAEAAIQSAQEEIAQEEEKRENDRKGSQS